MRIPTARGTSRRRYDGANAHYVQCVEEANAAFTVR